ncbi:MAG: hypothetical protein J6A63_03200 [Clostridia bacterium]|nr:hypothetical protein [Clostridia bacterium]
MKTKGMKRVLSATLIAATLLATLPTSIFASKTTYAYDGLPDGAAIGETLYEQVCTSADAFSDWKTQNTGDAWQWNPDAGSVSFDANEQGVRMQAEYGTQVATLPALGTVNFAYVVDVKVMSDSGSFGLVSDIHKQTSTSESAMHSLVYVNDATNTGIYQYTAEKEEHISQQYNNPVRVLGHSVKQGDVCTLALYYIDGMAYFYVDGNLAMQSYVYQNTIDHDIVGLYVNGADIVVKSVSVKKFALKGVSSGLYIEDVSIRYSDAEGFIDRKGSFGLRYFASVDKTNEIYRDAMLEYGNDVEFGMLFIPTDYLSNNEKLTKDTPSVIETSFTTVYAQTPDKLTFAASLLDIPLDDLDRSFTARMFMRKMSGNEWEYTYSKDSASHDLVTVANIFYEELEEYVETYAENMETSEIIESADKARERLDAIFGENENYCGGNVGRVKFSVFADFHYKENMGVSTIADIHQMMKKAVDNKADFIIQMGDFNNDAVGGPELYKAYLENAYDMPAYGIYGNHELEGNDAFMEFVTPRLTNRSDEVTWGTEDGKMRAEVGYYYFDVNGMRMICLDTDYYFNTQKQAWEHVLPEGATRTDIYRNPDGTAMYFDKTTGEEVPAGTANATTKSAASRIHSVGDVQRAWLTKVLDDAIEKKLPCLVFMHAPASGISTWSNQGGDRAEVRAIFKAANAKRAGTVMMVLNGHAHTNHLEMAEDILWMDVNTVHNGYWMSADSITSKYGDYASHWHYDSKTMKFNVENYDKDGNFLGYTAVDMDQQYSSKGLKQGKQTWYFDQPLSAIVSVSASGRIKVQGMETNWLYNVAPVVVDNGTQTQISSGTFNIKMAK